MIKKLIVILLVVSALIGLVPYAGASERVSARLSTDTFLVDDTRASFRVYEIRGQLYLSIFEIAVAFNGTEKQFFPRWNARQRTLNITNGRPYAAISFNLSRRAASNASATPINVNVVVDGSETTVSAFRIVGDIFLNLRDIVTILDVYIGWNPTDTALELNTRQRTRPDGDDGAAAETPIDIVSVARRGINPFGPMIALTFDDGPSEHTVPILDVLEKYNAVGTFYVVGQQIEKHPEILLRTFEMRHEIANHTWSHPDLSSLSEANVRTELVNTNNAIASVTGILPTNMRPPFARFNETVESVTEELGLPIILWSVDPRDWENRDADIIFDFVMRYVEDRDIILLHDLHASTAEATIRLVPALIERGFQLVTVTELMYFSDIAMQPGAIYRDGRDED